MPGSTKNRIAVFFASLSLGLGLVALAPAPAVYAQNFEGRCDDAANIDENTCGIVAYIQVAINILTAIVGVVIVIMIAVGGIQYSAARDNPQEAAAAKQKIYNAVLALVVYLFSFAFLQYIVPGGIF
jgi:hypothetical protein